jgi:interleukin-1 receptor-associated kinase 4
VAKKWNFLRILQILLELLTGLPPYEETREGNDIVTYLEEVVEDEDISPLLDRKAGNIDPSLVPRIYSLALKCLAEKKRRPTAEAVLTEIEHLADHFGVKNVL